MTTPKQISTYLFIAAFAAVNAWYFGFRKTQHSGYSIINGAEIVSIERADSSRPDRCVITYTYRVGMKNYTDTAMVTARFMSFSSDFINRSFPIAYRSNKPSDNYLLFYPQQFSALNQPFPDSLQRFFDHIQPGLIRPTTTNK
jgi:hypothetical protein